MICARVTLSGTALGRNRRNFFAPIRPFVTTALDEHVLQPRKSVVAYSMAGSTLKTIGCKGLNPSVHWPDVNSNVPPGRISVINYPWATGRLRSAVCLLLVMFNSQR